MRRILFVFLVWILAACTPLVPPAGPTARSVLIVSTALPREKLSPVPTWRLLFPPTPTATPVPPTVTATGTPSPTPAGPFCLQLAEPADGASLPRDMKVSLTWERVPKAASYVLLLSSPDGFQEKLLTSTTGMELDIQARDEPVSYRWSVQAYDSDSQLLCSSNTFIFTVLPVSASALTGTPGTPAATATGQ